MRKTAKKAPLKQGPGSAADFRGIAEEHRQELDNLLLTKKEYM